MSCNFQLIVDNNTFQFRITRRDEGGEMVVHECTIYNSERTSTSVCTMHVFFDQMPDQSFSFSRPQKWKKKKRKKMEEEKE